MKIYTRKGDDGTTGALFGGRFSKSDLRAETVGSIDEAVAVIGLARSLGCAFNPGLLVDLQRGLFVAGAEVATLPVNAEKLQDGVSKVTAEMVRALEAEVDAATARAPLPDYFVLPGGNPAAAALDVARSVIRRAERAAVAMAERGDLDGSEVLRYLNRMSDLLFALARAEEMAAGVEAPPSREG